MNNTKHITITPFTSIGYLWLFLMLTFAPTLLAQNLTDFQYQNIKETLKGGLPPGWDYQSNATNPHGVIVVLEANPRINQIPLKAGDYIGVFYTDNSGELKCGGADIWTGTENIIFAVFGNDPGTPEKDGFAYAETMTIKVYYQDNNKDYEATLLEWDPEYSSTNKWYPLGLSSISNLSCTVEFDAYASADPDTICVGESINLDAHIFIGTTGSYTYQWSSQPQGFSSSLQNTSASPQTNTKYLLEVSDGTYTSEHQIDVQVNGNPEINAGNDLTICIDQQAQLAAMATSNAGVFWTSIGDGTFENPETPTTEYYPGPQDIEAKTVLLEVTAFPLDPCQSESSDGLNIIMQSLPTISVPTEMQFCENQDMIVEANATLYTSLLWTTSGDGSFANPDSLSTQYFPGSSDLLHNEFNLTASASAINPCLLSTSDEVLVTTHDTPTLSAPSSRTVCENIPVNLNSIAYNYSSSQWITNGDGYFENPDLLHTKYFPGDNDLTNGGTTVSILAYGTGTCIPFPVSKSIEIIITPEPKAFAGENAQICHGDFFQTEGSATNYSYVNWTTNGDGIFDNPNLLNAVYFPGSTDLSSETFSLYLSANANYPCTSAHIDTLIVDILPQPTVEIGVNQALICPGEPYHFNQTLASNYSELEWFTFNGSGTFDDITLLHPTYHPDLINDLLNQPIILGISAYSESPCTLITEDFMSLGFQIPPEVYAGDDNTIIQGETFFPNPEADHYASLIWETSGDGTFNKASILMPEYFPGENDITNQGLQLSLWAESENGCPLSVSDTLNLSILWSQEIPFTEGENGFSTFINQNEKPFEEVIETMIENVVFAQSFNQVYWPTYNINTIQNFNNLSGYKIIMSENSNLQLTGNGISNKSIQLVSGWNILPVISACDINIQELSEQLGTALISIKEMDGVGTLWPPENKTTENELQTGSAYMIKVAGDILYTFPECSK